MGNMYEKKNKVGEAEMRAERRDDLLKHMDGKKES
jgi:hypothetical protein